MTLLSRWFAPAALAVGLGLGAMPPAMAQSPDDLVRVLVNVADVVFRGSTPYYRQGDYGYDDRLTVQRDRYGRPLYYRSVPRGVYYGNNGYNTSYNGYNNNGYANTAYRYNNPANRRVKCNNNGNCKVEYYDPRYDNKGHNTQSRYDRDSRGRNDRSQGRGHDDDDDD